MNVKLAYYAAARSKLGCSGPLMGDVQVLPDAYEGAG